MKTATLQDFPLFTFFPQFRNVVGDITKNKILESLKPVLEILRTTDSYGVLVMDDVMMPVISALFSASELTQQRLVLKEALMGPRDPQHKMFALYVFEPTSEAIKRIAEDFGYEPGQLVPRLEAIKAIRAEEKCCVPVNQHYNPYRYRGAFLFPSRTVENMSLTETGLVNILGKPAYTALNTSYVVRESHFIDLQEKESFTRLFLKPQRDNSQYYNAVASKLCQVFQNLGIDKVTVRSQKLPQENHATKIGQLFQQKFKALQGNQSGNGAILLVVDRSFDPMSLVAYNMSFGPLLSDLMGLEQEYGSYEDEQGQAVACVLNETNLGLSSVKHLALQDAKRAVVVATQQIQQVAENRDQIIQDRDSQQSVQLKKLDGAEFNTLAALKKDCDRKMTDVVVFYSAFTRYFNDKTMKVIFDCEMAVMRALLGMDGYSVQKLPQQHISESSMIIQYILQYSKKESSHPMVALRMAMLLILAFCVGGEAGNEKIVAELVTCVERDILRVKDKEKYKYAIKNFQQFVKAHCQASHNLGYLLAKYRDKLDCPDVRDSGRVAPTAIDIFCKLLSAGQAGVLDALFTGEELPNLMKIATKYSHSETDELNLAKARFYKGSKSSDEEIARQQAADKAKFERKDKVFIYVAGGVTYAEMTAVYQNSCQPGKLGLFNKGTQLGDREFFLISDFGAQPSAFIDQIASK